ncbi:MAG: tetratricopeptide repeat protein, partial [Thermoguttaceae bacterium]|nr:tetratricopeptide repeat protein [Thermoguttaceae bacterium]
MDEKPPGRSAPQLPSEPDAGLPTRGRVAWLVLSGAVLATIALLALVLSRRTPSASLSLPPPAQPQSPPVAAPPVSLFAPGAPPTAKPSTGASAEPDVLPAMPSTSASLPDTVDALNVELLAVVDDVARAIPANADALELKARVLDWLGKSADAAACWQECLALDPKYAYAYEGLGRLAARKEDYAQAAELLAKAIESQPGSFTARAALADVMLKTGRPQEAIEIMEPFRVGDPRSHAFFVTGQAQMQLGEFDKAKESFEAAIGRWPDYAEAYRSLGTACLRLHLKADAARAMRKATELRSKAQQARNQMRAEYDDFAESCRFAADTYSAAARLFADRPNLAS